MYLSISNYTLQVEIMNGVERLYLSDQVTISEAY